MTLSDHSAPNSALETSDKLTRRKWTLNPNRAGGPHAARVGLDKEIDLWALGLLVVEARRKCV